MLGKPRYKENQTVKFKFGETDILGKITAISKWGSVAEPLDVCYDILVENDGYYDSVKTFRHIPESSIVN